MVEVTRLVTTTGEANVERLLRLNLKEWLGYDLVSAWNAWK